MDNPNMIPLSDTTTSPDILSIVDPILLSTKRVIYVGGLPTATTISMLRAAFIPFGNINSIDMPMDYIKGIHRGFAFIEYEVADDADEAIFNMDLSEILGQTISVSIAQINQIHHLSTTTTYNNYTSNNNPNNQNQHQQAIWNHDEWFQQQIGQTTKDELNHIQNQKDDVHTLQKI